MKKKKKLMETQLPSGAMELRRILSDVRRCQRILLRSLDAMYETQFAIERLLASNRTRSKK